MSDPSTAPSTDQGQSPEVSEELTRSLTSIWRRHAGGTPSAVSTELRENAVKIVLEDAVSGIGSASDEDQDDGGKPHSPDSFAYRNEAIAAVRRITGRRVMGFIPKRDPKTDVASDTYILERLRVRR